MNKYEIYVKSVDKEEESEMKGKKHPGLEGMQYNVTLWKPNTKKVFFLELVMISCAKYWLGSKYWLLAVG